MTEPIKPRANELAIRLLRRPGYSAPTQPVPPPAKPSASRPGKPSQPAHQPTGQPV